MDVIVLDNGLVSCGEHSYQLLMEVCDALSQRSISYRVFGMKRMDAAVLRDIGATPWFSRSLYWGYRRRFPQNAISLATHSQWREILCSGGGPFPSKAPGAS